ncbi:unnamed protein product [Caretta caretta]
MALIGQLFGITDTSRTVEIRTLQSPLIQVNVVRKTIDSDVPHQVISGVQFLVNLGTSWKHPSIDGNGCVRTAHSVTIRWYCSSQATGADAQESLWSSRTSAHTQLSPDPQDTLSVTVEEIYRC